MVDTLDDSAVVEAVVKSLGYFRGASRSDVRQTVWVALLLAKHLDDDLVATTKRFAKALLRDASDKAFDVLRRVEFDETALAHPRYNDDGVDVSVVVMSTLRKLRKRDERDNLIFRRRFLRGEKQKTIAADLGLSAARISQRCQHVATVFIKEYNKAKKND
jgi:DNA-directed RNA polymerase specialized sigma subunit